ncbi:MAG: DUF4232 domain-containing protein [Solirubrobacteraceae bacterium]
MVWADRLRLGRIAVAGLILGAACCGIVRFADRASARGSPHPTVASNRALARTIAGDLIGRVPLPAGTVRVAANPGSSVWLGSSVAGVTIHVAQVHRFWRVAGDPRTVFEWIKSHRPAGAQVSGTGTGGQSGTTVAWFATFTYAPIAGEIVQRGIGVGVTAATGGGTAIRADAFAQWLIPRSPQEVVPAAARRVAVTVDRFGGPGFPLSSVSGRRAEARLVTFVDSRPVVQDAGFSCPAVGSFTRVLDLRFEGSPAGPPLARAVEDACGGLSFFIHGRRQRALIEGADLSDLLWRLRALPVCRASQLSATATRPSRQPRAILAELAFRDVSDVACALKGFGRVTLLRADGHPLRPAVHDAQDTGGVVLLTPADSAVIALTWPSPSRSCRGPRPDAIEAALPGPSGRYRVDVSAWPRRLAPCHSHVLADALS